MEIGFLIYLAVFTKATVSLHEKIELVYRFIIELEFNQQDFGCLTLLVFASTPASVSGRSNTSLGKYLP